MLSVMSVHSFVSTLSFFELIGVRLCLFLSVGHDHSSLGIESQGQDQLKMYVLASIKCGVISGLMATLVGFHCELQGSVPRRVACHD